MSRALFQSGCVPAAPADNHCLACHSLRSLRKGLVAIQTAVPDDAAVTLVCAAGAVLAGRVLDSTSPSRAPPADLLTLALEAASTEVSVISHAEDLVERDPSSHTDLDQSLIGKLLVESSSGLNQVVTLASPGVVSDSNGFFHPIGDHAQTQFSIDNQPVTDQQSRLYSTQISRER
jgi:hypothetical protein